eukprot:1419271-Rhodomonas_salina.1
MSQRIKQALYEEYARDLKEHYAATKSPFRDLTQRVLPKVSDYTYAFDPQPLTKQAQQQRIISSYVAGLQREAVAEMEQAEEPYEPAAEELVKQVEESLAEHVAGDCSACTRQRSGSMGQLPCEDQWDLWVEEQEAMEELEQERRERGERDAQLDKYFVNLIGKSLFAERDAA